MAEHAEPTRVHDKLVETATGLFAELGYDQTSTQMIADAAGVTTAVLAREVGGKSDLYLAVMERAHALQKAMLEQGAAEFTRDAAGVHRFLDRYLDFFVAHPQIATLWIQRRLSDAADIAGIEREYTYPQIQMVAQAVGDTVGADVDAELSLWTIAWCVHDFVQAGIPSAEGPRVGPSDRRTLARFRAHLHQMVERMIGLTS